MQLLLFYSKVVASISSVVHIFHLIIIMSLCWKHAASSSSSRSLCRSRSGSRTAQTVFLAASSVKSTSTRSRNNSSRVTYNTHGGIASFIHTTTTSSVTSNNPNYYIHWRLNKRNPLVWKKNIGTSVNSIASLCCSKYTTLKVQTGSTYNQQSIFLDQVEETIQNIFQKYNIQSSYMTQKRIDKHTIQSILESIDPSEREAVGIAIHLHNRIFALMKNNDCRRCWLQKAHCICHRMPSFESSSSSSSSSSLSSSLSLLPHNNDDSNNLNNHDIHTIVLPTDSIHRIFLLMHHKEIGMAVDTAKILLASFDQTCRLVVTGLDGEYQHSMNELMDALYQKERRCMVLFPSEDAMTFTELKNQLVQSEHTQYNKSLLVVDDGDHNKWDVVVIDGTWAQARKIYSRYIPSKEENGPYRVCLSQEAVDILNSPNNDNENFAHNDKTSSNQSSGRQLRRHPIKWREISTLEATRLMIRDVMIEEQKTNYDQYCNQSTTNKSYCFDVLSKYQVISDNAAKKQLGAPRLKQKIL